MSRSAEPTAERLLLLARGGEEKALGTLLGRYHHYLELLARLEIGRRLQNKLDTADLVQETFLEAHRNFKLFRGSSESEFVAWLRSILGAKVSNLIRHYIGTQGRDVRREQGLEVNLDQSSRMLDRGLMSLGSTPSQHVMRNETGVLLAEALAQLPEDYREVVMLRQLEELTFPEVAERMGRSVDSVQKLWVRALLQLRQKMKGFE
jgi:RNA polymerase sigma-70 factor (ECF subfamily)